MFNKRVKNELENSENGESMICPKCGNRFLLFHDYNRDFGGNLFWCECLTCKTTTITYRHKGFAIAAFKKGMTYNK